MPVLDTTDLLLAVLYGGLLLFTVL